MNKILKTILVIGMATVLSLTITGCSTKSASAQTQSAEVKQTLPPMERVSQTDQTLNLKDSDRAIEIKFNFHASADELKSFEEYSYFYDYEKDLLVIKDESGKTIFENDRL